MSIWSILDPLNWGKDITGAADSLSHSVSNALIQLLQLFMSAFAYLVDDVIYAAALVVYGVLQLIFSAADAAGPFALPAFLVMMTGFVIVAQIALDTVKDIPVLGAFT